MAEVGGKRVMRGPRGPQRDAADRGPTVAWLADETIGLDGRTATAAKVALPSRSDGQRRRLIPILETKTSPPIPWGLIARPRLVERIRANQHQRLLLLCAEAGYGKTSLLAEAFVSSHQESLWYRLDDGDRDVRQFIAYFLHLLRRRWPEFGQQTQRALDCGADEEKDELAALFSHELTFLPRERLLLILDDFTAVQTSPEVCRLVGQLLEYSPETLRFAIASRAWPPLPLARLGVSQQLLELKGEDLGFTAEETAAFLDDQRIHLAVDDVQLLQRASEGWPAGLALLTRALRQPGADSVMTYLRGASGPYPQAVDAYFCEQVFEREAPETRDFLLRTAVLQTLTPELCEVLAGVQDAGEVLRHMQRRGLFIRPLGEQEGAYRYQPLFRDFLQRRLSRLELRRLHAEAATLLERAGEWSQALQHYCSADLPRDAARLIEQAGEKLIDYGRMDRVLYWFSRVPASDLAERPWCLALRGRILHREKDYGGALRALGAAERLFSQRQDARGVTWVRCEMALVRCLKGQSMEAAHACAELLRQAGPGPAARSHVLSTLAMCALANGDSENAVASAAEGLAEADGIEDDHYRLACRTRALRHLALGRVYQLDLSAAARHARENLALCQRERAGRFQVGWALWTLGLVQTLRGDLAAACDSFEQAVRECGRYEHRQRERLELWRGTVLRALGDIPAAERCLQAAGGEAAGELALLYLQTGRPLEALRLAQDSLHAAKPVGRASPEPANSRPTGIDLLKTKRDAPRGEPNGVGLVDARAVLGVILREVGDYDQARIHLEWSADACRRSGDRLPLASILVHLAGLELRAGRAEQAATCAREALGLAAASGLSHFLWWDARTVAAVCAHALRAGIWPEYTVELAAQRLGPEECAPFLFLVAARGPWSGLATQLARLLIAKSNGGAELATDLLTCSADPALLSSLAEDLAAGLLGLDELAVLRTRHGITWKEIRVLSAYYLRPGLVPAAESQTHFRHRTAHALGISENTLKIHINSLRRKLGLTTRALGFAPPLVWLKAQVSESALASDAAANSLFRDILPSMAPGSR